MPGIELPITFTPEQAVDELSWIQPQSRKIHYKETKAQRSKIYHETSQRNAEAQHLRVQRSNFGACIGLAGTARRASSWKASAQPSPQQITLYLKKKKMSQTIIWDFVLQN